MTNKRCSICLLGTDVTQHNQREMATLTTENGFMVDSGQSLEDSWTFKVVRSCSEGGETVKDFDKCLKPREFSPRPIG